ncbi:UV DNA damage repair endonuclease UvsE [bacterium]|nr:UV DNA damage repair endonuclease UvsE [bacterium]
MKSCSEKHLVETAGVNLSCLSQILKYNIRHRLLFFRITSDLIPFASHPTWSTDWQARFKSEFDEIGRLIGQNRIRISMHPDSYTLINAEKESVFQKSQAELNYHVMIFESLGLETSAKIQIHIGGLVGNKETSLKRFVRRYHQMDKRLQRHLVIENDSQLFTAADCMRIYDETGIPVVLDVFHHDMNNEGEMLPAMMEKIVQGWTGDHGPMMVDYSSRQERGRKGTRAMTLDTGHFGRFIEETRAFDFDLMLEIGDKEYSALKAIEIVGHDARFVKYFTELESADN